MEWWEKIAILAICIWGWIFIYKLKGAELTKKLLGIEEDSASKYKRFVTGDRFFKTVFWYVTIGIIIVFILD